MSTAAAEPTAQTPIDAGYQAQRLRLAAAVGNAVAYGWVTLHQDRQAAISHTITVVTAGQSHIAQLVGAYMAAKSVEATGTRPQVILDPAAYTIATLRGVSAESVYGRPFGAYGAILKDGGHPTQALQTAQASIRKLAVTDLQLAQTHAARDWMREAAATKTDELRIVGYRRVLSGEGPHCKLCIAASTRTYRIADLMAIHEHCTCGVQPLYGTEPVASIGTAVRVEDDPELGPRLMADSWSNVGPRITA